MKKLMVIILSFVVIAAMIAVFSCGKSSPEEPAAPNTPTPTNTLVSELPNTPTPTNTLVSELPNTPTPTPTNIPVLTPTILYPFDTDQTGDWDVEGSFSEKTYNTTTGHNAPGCLQVTGDFSTTGAKGEIKRYLGAETDFTGKTITCWINIPAELVNATNPYGVQIFVQDDSWEWDAKWINITTAGWQKYEWILPESLNQDITQIVQVGIQISAGDGSPTVTNPVTILFDDINW